MTTLHGITLDFLRAQLRRQTKSLLVMLVLMQRHEIGSIIPWAKQILALMRSYIVKHISSFLETLGGPAQKTTISSWNWKKTFEHKHKWAWLQGKIREKVTHVWKPKWPKNYFTTYFLDFPGVLDLKKDEWSIHKMAKIIKRDLKMTLEAFFSVLFRPRIQPDKVSSTWENNAVEN